MPEESSEQPAQSQPSAPHEVNLSPPVVSEKKNKPWLIYAAVAVVVLIVLGAVGVLVLKNNGTNKKSTTENKSSTATDSAATSDQTKTETDNKIGYVDKGNIWVLDVTSKAKTQITKDGDTSKNIYRSPLFISPTTFVFVKVVGSGSQLWKGEFSGNRFTIFQDKTFRKPINLLDVSPDYKLLIFYYSDTSVTVHFFDLTNDKDNIVYTKDPVARGASQLDAFSAKLSPDLNKVLLVDTIFSREGEKIMVFDQTGKEIVGLKGNITSPVWVDNDTFVYLENTVGVHSYKIGSKKDTKLNSEKDWSGLVASPDGTMVAHNKGLVSTEGATSTSSVGIFNVAKKEDTLIGDNLEWPQWVNNNYVVMNKLKSCNSTDSGCPGDNSFMTDKVLVVYHLQSKQTYEIKTASNPYFR